MAENPIQFVWERPEIEVLVYYLVFIDLQCRLGGYPSLDVLRPPGGAPLDLSSGRRVYRRDRAIQMPYVVPALSCAPCQNHMPRLPPAWDLSCEMDLQFSIYRPA